MARTSDGGDAPEGEVVVDERHCVDHLDGAGSGESLGLVTVGKVSWGEAEHGASALPTAD
ncbi:hypothetical protein HPP92_024602 [Vanilla planifolia]|uniref:Uncharacterized protein n=1 Tax=Vanilla planifolia TaxID=51239 RepID=A0A835PMU3_VANPL|nr:hypothetical protein HPP92_024900 [Vanilla planifolia]KAG0456814.1 hypothetical protein HPP92_024602 [Vanilla planifolia]